MKNEEIRLRVRRLLNDSRNVEDLNRLFNWLRFRSRGDKTIKEVGDFAAHQDKRDQGITWKRAGDIFHNARMFMTLVESDKSGKPIVVSRKQMLRSLNASLELLGPAKVKQEAGIGFGAAKKLVAAAVQTEPPNWSDPQHHLIAYLMRRFSPEPVFKQEGLLASLENVLLKEGLMESGDREGLQNQSDFVAVYVISLMHLCEVDLGDGETGILETSVDPDGLIGIGAQMDNVIGSLGIGTPLFETTCKAVDWLEVDADAPWGTHFTVSCPLELGANGRLSELN